MSRDITKYKIRYTDTVTTYPLDKTFDSEEDAQDYIDSGEIDIDYGCCDSSCYEVEKV
tara:strand:+ start:337 stop:510 length:174 start_codon:yes stop_codon:yes gene_type:complete